MSKYGPHDHCKHGTYVGGCGIDWMCHYCEMGDPDPTIAEVKAEKLAYLKKVGQFIALAGELRYTINPTEFVTTLVHYDERIAEMAEYATSDDDANWLARRHAAECAAYDLEEHGEYTYTEEDEFHEYGYIPDYTPEA